MAALQNGRILRFLYIIGAVILTIFIYASYYCNIPLGIPPHIRTSSSQLLSSPSSSSAAIGAAVAAVAASSSSTNNNNNHNNNNNNYNNINNYLNNNNNNDIEFDFFNNSGNKFIVNKIDEKDLDFLTADGNNNSNNNTNNNSNSNNNNTINLILKKNCTFLLCDENFENQKLSIVKNNVTISTLLNSSLSSLSSSSSLTIGSIKNFNSTINNNQNIQEDNKILTKINLIDDKNDTIQNEIYNVVSNLANIDKTKLKTNDVKISKSLGEKESSLPAAAQPIIQKIIQNADKIVSNLSKSAIGGGGGSGNKNHPSSSSSSSSLNRLKQLSVAQPPSAVMPANRGQQQQQQSSSNVGRSGASANAAVSSAVADPTQTILTKQLYENGHIGKVNPMICPNHGKNLKLLILITSSLAHHEARRAIRLTWGNYNQTIGIDLQQQQQQQQKQMQQDKQQQQQQQSEFSIAFILGRSLNKTLELEVENENHKYGDLIRGHFIDSYNNLTLKTISSLEWIDNYCNKVNYVLKTDDDMFINVDKLLKFLDKHHKEKRIIYGRLAKKWKPIRNRKSKYYVSNGQFSSLTFPTFTTGPAYVLTSDIIHELYIKSLEQTYLKLEDVYITGIVAQQLGIKRVHINEFRNQRIAFSICSLRKTISVHMVKPNEQFDLWKKLQNHLEKCK